MLDSHGISDSEILETGCGFAKEDPLVFITGYRYSAEDQEAAYGY